MTGSFLVTECPHRVVSCLMTLDLDTLVPGMQLGGSMAMGRAPNSWMVFVRENPMKISSKIWMMMTGGSPADETETSISAMLLRHGWKIHCDMT